MSTTSTNPALIAPGNGEIVRVALVGGGLVGQVCHLPTITEPGSRTRLSAIVDVSAARAKTLGDMHGVPSATSLKGVLDADVDAVVIATPDASHVDLALEALQHGLHVFCEKPLGLSSRECRVLREAAEHARLVCQVGYMKRFDPAVNTLRQHLDGTGAEILGLAVEVRDPDAAPFVKALPFVAAGSDIPAHLGDEGEHQLRAELTQIIGRVPASVEQVAYTSLISALIHDLNLARFLVPDAMRVINGFYGMGGAQVGMQLVTGNGVHVRLAHSQMPAVADYLELFTVYTDKGIYELAFPAPYLLRQPTQLRYFAPMDGDLVSARTSLNQDTTGGFFLELQHFAEQIVSPAPAPASSTFADAEQDMLLLEEALRHATRHAET